MLLQASSMQLPYQTLTPTYLHPPTSPLTYFPAANLRPQAFYGHRSRQQTRRTNLVGQFDDRKRCCYSKSKLASLGMGWPLDKAHCKDVDGLLNPSFRQRGLCPYKIRPPCRIVQMEESRSSSLPVRWRVRACMASIQVIAATPQSPSAMPILYVKGTDALSDPGRICFLSLLHIVKLLALRT